MDRPLNARNMFRKSNRRDFLSKTAVLTGAGIASLDSLASTPLRFASTPVFLNDQISLLDRWRRYLETQIGRPVHFVQRGSYREIVDLLLNGSVDAAWLCGYPLILYENRLSVVAVPRYQGAALYRSHLIVPSTDSSTQRVLDLKGRIFAYSDPFSNSGYLVPRTEIVLGGQQPSTFFRRSFFTFSHRKVVEAVRAGLADAGAVDGYIWDTIAAQYPDSVVGLRVAWRSGFHGFPPVVARRNWAPDQARQLGDALLAMESSAEGRSILKRLNIENFEEPRARQFDSIRALLKLANQGAT
jgi:phosphonate transport system substrate-binding protein